MWWAFIFAFQSHFNFIRKYRRFQCEEETLSRQHPLTIFVSLVYDVNKCLNDDAVVQIRLCDVVASSADDDSNWLLLWSWNHIAIVHIINRYRFKTHQNVNCRVSTNRRCLALLLSLSLRCHSLSITLFSISQVNVSSFIRKPT